MKTLDRTTWKNVSCVDFVDTQMIETCDHTEEEHFAFDSGVFAGENETKVGEAKNPYSSGSPALHEAWEAGYACSRLWEKPPTTLQTILIAKENKS